MVNALAEKSGPLHPLIRHFGHCNDKVHPFSNGLC